MNCVASSQTVGRPGDCVFLNGELLRDRCRAELMVPRRDVAIVLIEPISWGLFGKSSFCFFFPAQFPRLSIYASFLFFEDAIFKMSRLLS